MADPKVTQANVAAENAALRAALEQAQAALEALKNKPAGRISLKVSEKGALSVYGLGRFPVTLYPSQWQRLLADEQSKAILAFVAANEAKFKAAAETHAAKVAAEQAAETAAK